MELTRHTFLKLDGDVQGPGAAVPRARRAALAVVCTGPLVDRAVASRPAERSARGRQAVRPMSQPHVEKSVCIEATGGRIVFISALHVDVTRRVHRWSER